MSERHSRDPSLARGKRAYTELQQEGSPQCPGTEELSALVIGETEQGERLRLADHVVSCRRCLGLYRNLRRLHEEAARELPGANNPPGRTLRVSLSSIWSWTETVAAFLAQANPAAARS